MASYPPPPPGYGGPPPPPGYGPPPGSYGGYPSRTTNGKAIAALICGICGFVVCPLTAVAAVILAPQAKREIAAQPDLYEGTGLAQAGQILGWIMVGLMVATVLFVIIAIVIGAATSTSTSLGALAG